MIVRELVTLLRYDADTSGADRMEFSLRGLMGTIAGLLAAHKITEIADAWATVEARVGLATSSVADQQTALAALYEMSQRTGQSYTETANLFTVVGRNAKELGLSLTQQLDLTETINKAMVIGGGSKESGKAALMQLGQALGSGVLRGEELNSVMEQAPRLAKAIADSFGVPIGKLKQLGATGGLTSKMVAEGLLKQAEILNGEFGKMPLTFARAFQTVETRFGRFIDQIGKATGLWRYLAESIVRTSDWVFDAIDRLAEGVGGLNNLVKLTGILLVAVFGPAAVAMLVRFASMIGLLLSPWVAVAAAIAAVGLAIDDVLAWMRGAASVTEDLIGPFSEWEATIQSWKATVGDAVGYAIDKAREFARYVSDAFSGHGAEIQGIRDEWAALWAGQDPMADLKSAIASVREMFRLMGDGIDLLFPSLGDLGKNWTLGGEVRQTLSDLREMIRSIREAGAWLNSLYASVSNFSLMDAGRSIANKFRSMTGQPPMDGDPELPPEDAAQVNDFAAWLRSTQTNIGNMPASSLLPSGAGNTNNANITATVTNNITTTSDTPAAIGAAAADGTRSGLRQSVGRELELATPGAEFGIGH